MHITRHISIEDHSCPVRVTETLTDPCSHCQKDENLPQRVGLSPRARNSVTALQESATFLLCVPKPYQLHSWVALSLRSQTPWRSCHPARIQGSVFWRDFWVGSREASNAIEICETVTWRQAVKDNLVLDTAKEAAIVASYHSRLILRNYSNFTTSFPLKAVTTCS